MKAINKWMISYQNFPLHCQRFRSLLLYANRMKLLLNGEQHPFLEKYTDMKELILYGIVLTACYSEGEKNVRRN